MFNLKNDPSESVSDFLMHFNVADEAAEVEISQILSEVEVEPVKVEDDKINLK